MSRRGFLQLGAALMWAGADRGAQNFLWGDNRAMLEMLPHAAALPASEGLVVAAGLGNQSGRRLAGTWARDVDSTRPIAYFNYDKDGIRPDVLARDLGAHTKRLGSLSICGHSAGALVALQAAHHQERPLRRVALLGSPFDIDDVKEATKAQIMDGATDVFGYDYAATVTYLMKLLSRGNEKGWNRNTFTEAYQQTRYGASPRLYDDHFSYIEKANLFDLLEDIRPIVNANTQVAYFASGNPEDDTVVNTATAVDKFSRFWAELGVTMSFQDIPGMKHARLGAARHKVKEWLSATELPKPKRRNRRFGGFIE